MKKIFKKPKIMICKKYHYKDFATWDSSYFMFNHLILIWYPFSLSHIFSRILSRIVHSLNSL